MLDGERETLGSGGVAGKEKEVSGRVSNIDKLPSVKVVQSKRKMQSQTPEGSSEQPGTSNALAVQAHSWNGGGSDETGAGDPHSDSQNHGGKSLDEVVEVDPNRLAKENEIFRRKIIQASKKYKTFKDLIVKPQKVLVAALSRVVGRILVASGMEFPIVKGIVGGALAQVCGGMGGDPVKVYEDCFDAWEGEETLAAAICDGLLRGLGIQGTPKARVEEDDEEDEFEDVPEPPAKKPRIPIQKNQDKSPKSIKTEKPPQENTCVQVNSKVEEKLIAMDEDEEDEDDDGEDFVEVPVPEEFPGFGFDNNSEICVGLVQPSAPAPAPPAVQPTAAEIAPDNERRPELDSIKKAAPIVVKGEPPEEPQPPSQKQTIPVSKDVKEKKPLPGKAGVQTRNAVKTGPMTLKVATKPDKPAAAKKTEQLLPQLPIEKKAKPVEVKQEVEIVQFQERTGRVRIARAGAVAVSNARGAGGTVSNARGGAVSNVRGKANIGRGGGNTRLKSSMISAITERKEPNTGVIGGRGSGRGRGAATAGRGRNVPLNPVRNRLTREFNEPIQPIAKVATCEKMRLEGQWEEQIEKRREECQGEGGAAGALTGGGGHQSRIPVNQTKPSQGQKPATKREAATEPKNGSSVTSGESEKEGDGQGQHPSNGAAGNKS